MLYSCTYEPTFFRGPDLILEPDLIRVPNLILEPNLVLEIIEPILDLEIINLTQISIIPAVIRIRCLYSLLLFVICCALV